MISLIHPSRGRPQKSVDTLRKWVMKCGGCTLEVIVSLDNDDPTLGLYQQCYKYFPHAYTFLVSENKYAVGAINRAARVAQGDIFIVVSDDQEPTPRWGERIIKYTNGRNDWVLKSIDGIQPKMITLPILDRVYYQRDGYIYYPEYQHLFADAEFSDVAYRRKRVITKNIRFPHRHYSVTKGGQPDTTYVRNNSTYWQGKQLYQYRKSINFGL